MSRLFLFVGLVIISTGFASAQTVQRDLGDFVLNAGITVGKARACGLDNRKVVRAAEYSFAVINTKSKTKAESAKATELFAGAIDLGTSYIRDNGKAHCSTVNKTLDVMQGK
jgi:hypothetical protein